MHAIVWKKIRQERGTDHNAISFDKEARVRQMLEDMKTRRAVIKDVGRSNVHSREYHFELNDVPVQKSLWRTLGGTRHIYYHEVGECEASCKASGGSNANCPHDANRETQEITVIFGVVCRNPQNLGGSYAGPPPN